MRCDTTLQRTLRKRAAAGRFSKQAGRCIAVMASMFMAFLIPLTVLSGCAAASQDDASVRVFYLNAENNALVPQKKTLRAESVYGQTQELLDYLAAVPADEVLHPPISGFEKRDFSIEKNTVTLEFSGEYRELDSIREKLTRAAIVNTLCELEDIRRVTIRVNGALLVDDHGNKSENMTADQFIYNSGREMLNFERTEMHLYFASRDGKELVQTYRAVVFNSNIPMERLVVEQIIAGPNSDFSFKTVNENTKLVNILTRDNICTVTLDKAFLTIPQTVDPEVTVYSIVNSLTDLPAIRQVQIIIDGEDNPVTIGDFTLDSETLLQRNEKIIQNKE